jgi:hypothetical protein
MRSIFLAQVGGDVRKGHVAISEAGALQPANVWAVVLAAAVIGGGARSPRGGAGPADARRQR